MPKKIGMDAGVYSIYIDILKYKRSYLRVDGGEIRVMYNDYYLGDMKKLWRGYKIINKYLV